VEAKALVASQRAMAVEVQGQSVVCLVEEAVDVVLEDVGSQGSSAVGLG